MAAALITPRERPVFVAADDRRARRLRYAAALGVALSCAWLAALTIGMLGVGRLPGLSLPLIAHGADKSPAAEHLLSESSAVATPTAVQRAAKAQGIAAAAASGAAVKGNVVKRAAAPAHAKSAKNAHSAKPRTTPPPQTVPSSSPATPAATARQGWARRGLTAPPGRARTAEPKAKATASPGQARHTATDPTTAPATPVATPVPPGQQKKPDDPTQKS
jgi:hypothetical protein